MDWKGNNLLGNPHDCTTAIVEKEGRLYPRCAALVDPSCEN